MLPVRVGLWLAHGTRSSSEKSCALLGLPGPFPPMTWGSGLPSEMTP